MNKMLFGIILLSCFYFIQMINLKDSFLLKEAYPTSNGDEEKKSSLSSRFPWKRRDSDCDDDNSYDDDEYFD